MARKRLNKNVVVGLTLFGFLCMILASFLMLRNLRNVDPQHFVSLGQQYAAQGQYRDAALFYLKAWQVSQDPAYLVPHGEMLLAEGEVGGALNAWSQALITKPDLLDAHRQRVSLLLEIGRLYGSAEDWRRALEAAEALTGIPGEMASADRALGLHARGTALTSLGADDPSNIEKGLADLAEAHRLAPDQLGYAIELAKRQLVAGQGDDGEKLLRELIGKHSVPSAAASKVRLAFATYLAQLRDPGTEKLKEVEKFFQEARAFSASDPAASYEADLGYAGFLAQQWQKEVRAKNDPAAADGVWQSAEEVLKGCIAADGRRFEAYIQLASLYQARQRHADIVPLCEARLTQGFSRRGIQAAREKLFTFQLMIMASEACVSHALRTDGPLEPAQKGEWLKRAMQFADDAAGEFRSHPRVISEYGRIKLAQGKDREALEDFRKAEEGYRASDVVDWENKLILARLHVRLQEPGAAKQVLEEVIGRVSGPTGVPFWLLYAQVLTLNNEINNPRLATALAEVQRHDPENIDALRIQATVFERQGKVDRAREIIDRIAPKTGLAGMSTLLEARAKFLDKDPEAGIAVLLEGLKKTPADSLLVNMTTQELLARGRGEEARAVVAAALKEQPEDRRLQQLAVAARADLSSDQRRDAVRAVIESEPDAFQRAWDLADFWMREHDEAKTLLSLTEAEQLLLARETPMARETTVAQHRELLKAKMIVAARLKDDAVMEQVREAAAKYDIDGAGGKTLLGMYHMLREEYAAAILAWRSVIVEQPTHTRSLASLAQCLHQTGETEEAVSWYERALEINPDEPAAHRGLAMLARERGNQEEYTRHLAACERLIPNDTWVAAELMLRKEEADPQGAIVRREAELKQKPDDPANLMRLALLSETVKDVDRADGYYEQLLRLRPDERELIVQAGKYFRRTRRPERALELTQRFVDSRTTAAAQADAWILVAAHHLNQNNFTQVEKTLLQAAGLAQTFEITHSLGEFYLRKMDRADLALPWYDKAAEFARQDKLPKLPMVLASRIACALNRGVDDVDKARGYIEEYRREFPDDPRAALWESDLHVRVGRIDDAVAAITRYLTRRSNDASALYQRARLYASLGRLPAAMDDLESIRRTSPRALGFEPRLLLARLLEQSGRADLAVRELETLTSAAPQSDHVREALIDAYIRAQRFADADRVATAQINRTDVPADHRWYFLRARVSLALKDSGKALADMHRGAEVAGFSPDRLADVLDVYAKLERYVDGVAYFQKHASAGDHTARLLSRYALLLVRAGKSAEGVGAFREAMKLAVAEGGDAVRGVTANVHTAFPDANVALTLFETPPPPEDSGRANDRILVRLFTAANRRSEALTRLDKLVGSASTERERAELLLERGTLHQESDDAVRARESYEEALKHDPTNWIILNNLAYLLSDQLGEHAAALPHAKAAVRSVESADTLDTLGWVYVQLGEYPSAIAELSRALQFGAVSPTVYYHLGEAYRRDRQFKDAAEVLRAGLDLARSVKDQTSLPLLEAALEKAQKEDAGAGKT